MHSFEIKDFPFGIVVHLDVGVGEGACDLLQSLLLLGIIGVVENESVGFVVEVISQVAVIVIAEELSEHLVSLVAALFVLHDVG